MAINFWLAQEKAKRKTLWMIAAFVLLTIGVAILSDFLVGVFWPEYRESSPPIVAFGFILVTVAVALYNYTMYQSQGGSYVAESLGALPVSRSTPKPQERQLINIVEEIAVASGLPMPAVYILPNEQINAFAAGTTPENACICVTTGCMRLLNRDELQGVIGHEFGHIYNADMRLSMRLAAMLMGFFIIFYVALRLLQFSPSRRDEGGKGSPSIIIALILVGAGALSWVAGKILASMVSRQREYLADATSVQFTRNPEALVSALTKIQNEAVSNNMPKSGMAFSHLYFDNRSFLGGIFASHPPLENRIKALLGKESLPQ